MVLIVDDNPDVCRAMELLITARGRRAKCVSSGQAALELVAESPPECVVLDDNMPDLTGLDVLRTIRESFKLPIPVIIFSGADDDKRRMEALRLGAVDWVPKTAIDRLLKRVDEVLANPVSDKEQ
jgi:two-component system KDP operon response regulator KdpE